MARATDRVDDREPKPRRQIIRLVEATTPSAGRMQGNRDDGVGVVQPVTCSMTQHAGKRCRERPSAAVLERVNHCPERPLVQAGSAARR